MKNEQQWGSKIGFILAAAGSAIGLGAIWKFPYITGTNGGGFFLLIFLIFTLLLGAPLLLAEFVIGRNAKKDAINSFRKFEPNKRWHWIGYLGLSTSILLLSYYSVIGGWIISYLLRVINGSLSGLENSAYEATFNSIISHSGESMLAQFVFILITVLVVRNGIQQGIEKASKIMMPALFIIFIVLAARSLTLDGAMEGVKFLFTPNINDVTANTFVIALGQAFFALSLGLTVMLTYASYLPKNEALPKAVNSVIWMNILISLLAGLVIFPAVFALNFQPDSGPGLIFIVLPAVFNQMPMGQLFFILFLILMLFATLTSAFSILEMVVATWVKDQLHKRKKATVLAGLLIFVIGIPSALANGVISDFKIMGLNFFDFADFFVSNILMPIGAIGICAYTIYVFPKDLLKKEIETGMNNTRLFKPWYFIMKYLAPALIVIVIITSVIAAFK